MMPNEISKGIERYNNEDKIEKELPEDFSSYSKSGLEMLLPDDGTSEENNIEDMLPPDNYDAVNIYMLDEKDRMKVLLGEDLEEFRVLESNYEKGDGMKFETAYFNPGEISLSKLKSEYKHASIRELFALGGRLEKNLSFLHKSMELKTDDNGRITHLGIDGQDKFIEKNELENKEESFKNIDYPINTEQIGYVVKPIILIMNLFFHKVSADVTYYDNSLNVSSFSITYPFGKVTCMVPHEIVQAEALPKNYYILMSRSAERYSHTPNDTGSWEGKRGDSKFIINDEIVNQFLAEQGIDGIEYSSGIPDFSPVAKAIVEIDGMTDLRQDSLMWKGNFKLADEKLAAELGMTPREVKQWRIGHGYTWHECNDMKTMQLVPKIVNSKFIHLGGVSEVKKLISMLDFDEVFENELED